MKPDVCIGFLGGTGIEARGLALRFAAAGACVVLGSRSHERAAQAAETCNAILGQPLIHGAGNGEMLSASEIIFLTVPFAQAVDAVQGSLSQLASNHIIVDVTVPMVFRRGHAEYLEQERVSNSEIIARHLPDGVPLVAAFKTIPAFILAQLATDLSCDVLVSSDVVSAKQQVMAAASLIPSLRPLDGGPLRAARTLERMAVLAAEMNRYYGKKEARYRVVGI
jgi:NADPH-dependent F420 reductase